MPEVVVFGISTGFPELSRSEGQIAHVLLTRSPLVYSRRSLTARLACVKHAASVRPEPGSNSPLKMSNHTPERAQSTQKRKQIALKSKRQPKMTDKKYAGPVLHGKKNTNRQPKKLALTFVDTLLSSQTTHAAPPGPRPLSHNHSRLP